MTRRRSAGNQPPPLLGRSGRIWFLIGIAVVGAFSVVVAAAVLMPPRTAGPIAWSRLGTQDVHSLAFPRPDASTVLFGHHGGIMRSADGGRTWAPLPVRQDAMGMAAATDGSIVIAGHLVFQASRDGGATWTPINADLPSLDIHGFARSLSDPFRMWAYLAEGGIYESTDFGSSWALVNEANILQLTAIHRGDVDELLGIDLRGLVRSADSGGTWLPTAMPPTAPVTSLAATADGKVIILGGPDGLYRSDDAGTTWRHVLTTRTVLASAITDDGQTLAAVTQETLFYRSDDGGASWQGPS